MDKLRNILDAAEQFYSRGDAPLILFYNCITDNQASSGDLTVTAKNFERHIQYLQQKFNIVHLSQISSLSASQHNTVSVTIACSSIESLATISRILDKCQVPVTIFITSGSNDLFLQTTDNWQHQLERIFIKNEHILGKTLPVRFGQREEAWHVDSKEMAEGYLQRICSILKDHTEKRRNEIISLLLRWAAVDLAEPLNNDFAVALAEAGSNNLIEIGLQINNDKELSPSFFNTKLGEYKRKLETIVRVPVKCLAYSKENATSFLSQVSLLNTLGFSCAVTNIRVNAIDEYKRFGLARQTVTNVNVNYFQQCVEHNTKHVQKELFSFVKKEFLTAVSSCEYNNDKSNNSNQAKTEQCDILQISHVDNIGGAAKVAYILHNKFRDRNYKTRMLVDGMVTNDRDVDILMRDMSVSQRLFCDIQDKEGWLDVFHLSSFSIKNLEVFKNAQVLQLHNLHSPSNYFTYLALPELSRLKPTVWTFHDMQPITGHCAHSFDCEKWINGCEGCPYLMTYPALPKDKDTASFLWNIKKLAFKACENLTIVCPSDWLRKKVQKSILGDKRVELIYNGVDEQKFINHDKAYARSVLNLPQDKVIILFASASGADNGWKGGKYLFEMYEQMKHQDNVLFVNVGGKETVWRSSTWLDVAYVSDVGRLAMLYSAADLFVYPSLADNCPLVVLEALSCGTPVISFETGGIPELVEHLKTGYIAGYQNLPDLASGVSRFINDPDLRRSAAIEARKAVQQKYSITTMIDQYEQLYRSLREDFDQRQSKPEAKSFTGAYPSEKFSANTTPIAQYPIIEAGRKENHQPLKKRLRLGYLIDEPNNPRMGYHIEAILACHDANEFEVFCYSGLAVESNLDEQKTKKTSEHWLDIRTMSDDEVVDAIRADCLDALIVCAISSTQRPRLVSELSSLASVRVNWGVYCNTEDIPDSYIIADHYTEPIVMASSEPERMLRLPVANVYYRPLADSSPIGDLPAERQGHVSFGVILSSGQIEQATVAVLAQIVKKTPKSILNIYCSGSEAEQCREKIRAMFVAQKIKADRIRIQCNSVQIPSVDWYTDIDIVLDTFQESICSISTCDALWMGVPVIALSGKKYKSRLSVSVLYCAGLDSLVVVSLERYKKIAVELAGDWRMLKQLRQSLRKQLILSPLTDAAIFTKALEKELRNVIAAKSPC